MVAQAKQKGQKRKNIKGNIKNLSQIKHQLRSAGKQGRQATRQQQQSRSMPMGRSAGGRG